MRANPLLSRTAASELAELAGSCGAGAARATSGFVGVGGGIEATGTEAAVSRGAVAWRGGRGADAYRCLAVARGVGRVNCRVARRVVAASGGTAVGAGWAFRAAAGGEEAGGMQTAVDIGAGALEGVGWRCCQVHQPPATRPRSKAAAAASCGASQRGCRGASRAGAACCCTRIRRRCCSWARAWSVVVAELCSRPSRMSLQRGQARVWASTRCWAAGANVPAAYWRNKATGRCGPAGAVAFSSGLVGSISLSYELKVRKYELAAGAVDSG
jgi:hypothetical protein